MRTNFIDFTSDLATWHITSAKSPEQGFLEVSTTPGICS